MDFTKEKKTDEVVDEKSVFPEFLFKPLFNHFDGDDGFYQVVSNEYYNIKEVLKLKRKYRDYHKWSYAMSVYNEYMDYLADKYGSLSVIENSIEEGYPLDDYIPSKPKLKKNPINKAIMKTGIVPAQKSIDGIDKDLVRMISDEMYQAPSLEDIASLEYDSIPEYTPKGANKRFRKAMDEDERKSRVQNVKMKKSRHSGADIIEDYYNQLQSGGYNAYGQKNYKERSLTEIVEEMERREIEDPEIAAYEESLATNPWVYVNGSGMKKERADQLAVIRALMREGYSIENLGGNSSMEKRAVKMLKMEFGITDSISTEDMRNMSKKQRKKAKKKMKKQAKRSQIRDERIDSVLMANKIHHGGNNIDFRINNLFRD